MLIPISLRSPNGQSRVQIDDDATLRELVELIKAKTELSNFSLKYGYPLRGLDISPSLQDASIKDLKLRGETIVVAPIDTAPPAPAMQPASTEPKPKPFTPKGIEPDETSLEWPERGGHIGESCTDLGCMWWLTSRKQCSGSCRMTTAACVSVAHVAHTSWVRHMDRQH
jgi:ubiquitin thioesterase OTU1